MSKPYGKRRNLPSTDRDVVPAESPAALREQRLLFVIAGFIYRKIKLLAIIIIVIGIIAFYLIFRSGAFTGAGSGDINALKDQAKDKVVEGIKKEFRR